MTKIYAVMRMYKDIDRSGEVDYSETIIDKVFDTKEKAVNYIRDISKAEYEWVDENDPRGDKLIKYFVPDTIQEDKNIAIYGSYGMFKLLYRDIELCYKYISKDVS